MSKDFNTLLSDVILLKVYFLNCQWHFFNDFLDSFVLQIILLSNYFLQVLKIVVFINCISHNFGPIRSNKKLVHIESLRIIFK